MEAWIFSQSLKPFTHVALLLLSSCLSCREVVASPSLLNMADRVDWKACKVSEDEEKKMAAAFRKKFQPFDFNLT